MNDKKIQLLNKRGWLSGRWNRGILVEDGEGLVDLRVERGCILKEADEFVVVHFKEHPSNLPC